MTPPPTSPVGTAGRSSVRDRRSEPEPDRTVRSRHEVDHTPGRAQQWDVVDDDVRRWVQSVVGSVVATAEVTAVYVHGSLASGSFYRPKSDVDLLVIIEQTLTEPQRRALAVELLERHDRRPILGGLELSMVLRDSVAAFGDPVPCELHFSEMWAADVRRGGAGPRVVDPDLAAHCAMARSRGVALVGPEPDTILGEVPAAAFLDAVMGDARWIIDGGIVESPFYGVLNLCRCLQLMVDDPGRRATKDEGAQWAIESVPSEHRPLIGMAVECYRSSASVPAATRRVHGHHWDRQPLLDFAEYARGVFDYRLA